MEEKLKYSKWKAADIAKALREGRKPTPGAPGEAEQEAEDRANVETITATNEAAERLANLSAIHPDKEQEYVDREMAKLTAIDDDNAGNAISPPDNVDTEFRDLTMGRAQSQISYDAMDEGMNGGAAPLIPVGSPNFSRPLSTHSNSFNFAEASGSFAPQNGISGGNSPSPRPLPMPPASATSNHRREGLPMPPGGQGNVTPLIPPPHILSPSLPTQSTFMPSQPSLPQIPTQTYPSAPPVFAPAPQAAATLPSSLDSSSISRVQKLARWAISALDYDDIETARKHLREALDMCEGKPVAPSTKR